MSIQLLIGGAVLISLIGFQVGVQRFKIHRMKKWWALAGEAVKRDDLPAAEAALYKCTKLLPMWVPARTFLGGVLMKRGKLKEAEVHFRMAAELQPREADGHVQLGMFYATQFPDRGDEALEALSQGVAHAPQLREKLAQDPRLTRLRNHPRFLELFGGTSNS